MYNPFKRFFNAGQEQQITPVEAPVKMPDLELMSTKLIWLMDNTSREYLPSNVDLEDFISEMLRDPDLETELSNFKSFVLQGRINFEAANTRPESIRAAEICNEVLTPTVLKDFYDKSMHCMEQGFSVVWAKFKEENRLFTIDKFSESKYTNFTFDYDGVLIDRNTLNQLLEPNWLVTTFRERHGDKHGRSIFLTLYWIMKFEKLGYKQIITLFDKLGVPSFAALLKPSGNDEKDQLRANTIASAIKNIRSHSGVAITAEDIKKLEASSGAIKEIDDFIRGMKEIKTRVIMGALLTSGTTGSSGTYNLAENHKAITEMRVTDLGELIAGTITSQLIPLICRLNINANIQAENMPNAVYNLPVFSGLDDMLKVIDKFEGIKIKAGTLKTVYKTPIENDDDEILMVKSKTPATAGQFSQNDFDNFFFQKAKSINK